MIHRLREASPRLANSGVLNELPKMNEGAVAQLGERLPCTQEVRSSILLGSTTSPTNSVVEVRCECFAW